MCGSTSQDEYSEKYKRDNMKFSQAAYDQMLKYHWRGNVRELQHVIERAILLSKTNTISSMDIHRDPSQPVPAPETGLAVSYGDNLPVSAENGLSNIGLSGEELFAEIGRYIVENLEEPVEGADQSDVFNNLESGVVLAALKRTRGNKQAAANLLGLYRPRLYGMIKRHKLEELI